MTHPDVLPPPQVDPNSKKQNHPPAPVNPSIKVEVRSMQPEAKRDPLHSFYRAVHGSRSPEPIDFRQPYMILLSSRDNSPRTELEIEELAFTLTNVLADALVEVSRASLGRATALICYPATSSEEIARRKLKTLWRNLKWK